MDIFRSVMCGGSYYFLGLGLMRGFILFALLVFPLYAWGKSCGDGGPVGGGHYPHQGQAYEAAVKMANFQDCFMRGNGSNIEHHPRDSLYAVRVPGAIAGYYYYDDTCESRSSRITPRYPVTGSLGCNSGCLVSFIRNGDDETTTESTTGEVCDGDKLKEMCESKSGGNANYVYLPGMRVCHPVQPECPEGQQPKHGVCEPLDACPHGTITDKETQECIPEKEACPVGQVRAPDGSCAGDKEKNECPSGQARGADGTCKADADHDGIPDDEQDSKEKDKDKDKDKGSSFSGGERCDVPPQCSGDPVMCGQARIQWRIECSLRRDVKITGGACDAQPICTGEKCNAMEYASLLLQWRTACALEKGSAGAVLGGDKNQGNADVGAIKDALTGKDGTVDTGEEGDSSGVFSDESGYGREGYPKVKIDDKGRGYSRVCPKSIPINVFGNQIVISATPVCQFLQIGGKLVLILAALACLRIMGGSLEG
ncbi:virulence factor TspB C-terminal domain-related protein [Xylella fastidiosa]|uniref:virulence factor TspB C-terminal domain-related protein n=2 Tax=Xylella fastidiosa TaxID=2371 RepID=UPI001B379413|nr:virulence factor TspB C-terminal domain-related protein [Xylella fastidiosa]QTX28440.1 hypothetical protein KBP49_02685 [Xylella fastidiosa subsp. multiplex]